MSDSRTRDIERAYRTGAASRLEWVSSIARVQPLLVELAAYCYDEDALAALGTPPMRDTDPHLWATTLPHVVRAAGKEWPTREVEVRAALCLATVCVHAWGTLMCERPSCVAARPEGASYVGSGHLHAMHYDEVYPALNWAERAIGGRTSWARLAAMSPFGIWLDSAWLDQERPLSHARMAVAVVASRLPGQPLVMLSTPTAGFARWTARHESDEGMRRAREHILTDFPKRLASDLAPWVLGDRDPVRERLRARGQHEARV